MKTKRVEITVETYEIVLLRRRGKSQIWCTGCGNTVEAMKPEDAAIEFSIGARLVYQWVESGRLHFTECPDGSLLICLNSLQKSL